MSTSGHATFHGAIKTGARAAVVTDPLATLAPPPQPANRFVAGSYAGPLQPGTYVGGITVLGNSSVTLASGIYYLQGGGLTVSGNASVTGAGVVLYITSLSGKNPNSISLSGGAAVTLTAPTTGTYQGIAIFQDRTSSAAITISGNAGLKTTGTLYAPGAKVSLSGNASIVNPIGTSFGSQWIVADLALTGNAQFAIDANAGIRCLMAGDPVGPGWFGSPSYIPSSLPGDRAILAMEVALALWTAAGRDPATLQGLGLTTVTSTSLPAPYLGMAVLEVGDGGGGPPPYWCRFLARFKSW